MTLGDHFEAEECNGGLTKKVIKPPSLVSSMKYLGRRADTQFESSTIKPKINTKIMRPFLQNT